MKMKLRSQGFLAALILVAPCICNRGSAVFPMGIIMMNDSERPQGMTGSVNAHKQAGIPTQRTNQKVLKSSNSFPIGSKSR